MAGPFFELHRLGDGARFFINADHIVVVDQNREGETRLWVTSSTTVEETLLVHESIDDIVGWARGKPDVRQQRPAT